MTLKIPDHVDISKPFTKWELTVRDTFSWKVLYKRVHDWLVEEGWDALDGSKDYETYYFERDVNGQKFNVIWWRLQKDPLPTTQGYVKLYVILDFDAKFMTPKEVMHNGQKVKLDSGELKVNFQIFLVESHGKAGDEWNTHPILKLFKNRFWNRINKGVISGTKAEIITFSNKLYQLIQEYTGVIPERDVKPFVPVKGTHN